MSYPRWVAVKGDTRGRFFAHLLESALASELVNARDLLADVTPKVMAQHLPPAVFGELFRASLATGAMNADRTFATVTPEILAEYVPPSVLWQCIRKTGERAGLGAGKDAKGINASAKRFVFEAVSGALDIGGIST